MAVASCGSNSGRLRHEQTRQAENTAKTARRTARREQAIQREVDRTDAARKARGRTHAKSKAMQAGARAYRTSLAKRLLCYAVSEPVRRLRLARSEEGRVELGKASRSRPRSPLAVAFLDWWALKPCSPGTTCAASGLSLSSPLYLRIALATKTSAFVGANARHWNPIVLFVRRMHSPQLGQIGAGSAPNSMPCRLSGLLPDRDGDRTQINSPKDWEARFRNPILAAFHFCSISRQVWPRPPSPSLGTIAAISSPHVLIRRWGGLSSSPSV